MALHLDAKETTPLVGARHAAPDAAASMERVVRTPAEEYKEKFRRLILVPYKPFPWWRRLPCIGADPGAILPGQPLDAEQMEMLENARRPGYFKRLAMHRECATHVLHYYNAMHPENEYEPAPGEMTYDTYLTRDGFLVHGNLVARRKRPGCFSFLPAPRRLFFFEVLRSNGFTEVVTCTPLDEPITEAYSVLGFPLWWSKRLVAKWIPSARHVPVAFIFHSLALRKYLAVDITTPVKSVKCAINTPMCCIQTISSLIVLIRDLSAAERWKSELWKVSVCCCKNVKLLHFLLFINEEIHHVTTLSVEIVIVNSRASKSLLLCFDLDCDYFGYIPMTW